MKSMVFVLACAMLFATTPAYADVLCVQSKLIEMGFNPGPADGELGRRTASASEEWAGQADVTLEPLSIETSGAWCDALTSFASTPAATTVFADSQRALTAVPDENTGFEALTWIGDRKFQSYRQVVAVDDRVVSGRYIERFEIRDGDCGRTGDYNDCEHDREHIGWNEEGSTPLDQEVWYTFSLMAPASPNMGEINTILAEFRPIGPGQINLSIELQKGELVAVVGSTTVEQEDDLEPPPVAKWQSLGYLFPNRWYEFTLQAVWSRNEGGHLVLTQDGKVKLDFKGPNTAFEKPVHMQYGIYRPYVGDFDGPLPTQIVYFDNVHKAADRDELPR